MPLSEDRAWCSPPPLHSLSRPSRVLLRIGNCGASARARMMFHKAVAQFVRGQVRIDLSCRDVSMSENRLNGSQVGAVLNHMRGAAVPQHVWTGVARALR